jgi:hypothetical protein
MLLGSVLFLTGVWHERTLIAGLQFAPGPLVVALISGQVKRVVVRFGPRAVGVAGSLLMAAAGLWWALRLGATPNYAGAFLPGMIVGGLGVGLTQATLYGVIAGVLPPNRFATGSGVLNMSRQIALALGVAILIAILGSAPGVAQFHTGDALIAIAGVIAAGFAAWLPRRAAA